MDFKANANISRIIGESTIQGKRGDRATRIVKQSTEKVAAKKPSKPAKTTKQRVDPSERTPCQELILYTNCTCDMEEQDKPRTRLDAAEDDMEIDVGISTSVEELSK
jgi:hypothetical protein